MYELKEESKRNLEYFFEKELGIKYEEYEQLDSEQQQKLITEHHKRTKGKKTIKLLL